MTVLQSAPWAAPLLRLSRYVLLLGGLVLARPSLACWEEIGNKYQIQPHLLYAIAKTESNLSATAINRNKNGSYDIGIMQINSSWFPRLKKYGIAEQDLYDACTNIEVGAWILAHNLAKIGNSWQAIGAYNSSNPAIGLKYANRVYKNLPLALIQSRAMEE